MKNTSKKTALSQTAEEYASRSASQGIGYVFDRDLNFVDRLLWLLLVLAFAAVAAALTWNFWTQWRDEQVIHTKDLLGALIIPSYIKTQMVVLLSVKLVILLTKIHRW